MEIKKYKKLSRPEGRWEVKDSSCNYPFYGRR